MQGTRSALGARRHYVGPVLLFGLLLLGGSLLLEGFASLLGHVLSGRFVCHRYSLLISLSDSADTTLRSRRSSWLQGSLTRVGAAWLDALASQ